MLFSAGTKWQEIELGWSPHRLPQHTAMKTLCLRWPITKCCTRTQMVWMEDRKLPAHFQTCLQSVAMVAPLSQNNELQCLSGFFLLMQSSIHKACVVLGTPSLNFSHSLSSSVACIILYFLFLLWSNLNWHISKLILALILSNYKLDIWFAITKYIWQSTCI
jgi:hypothetical protein